MPKELDLVNLPYKDPQGGYYQIDRSAYEPYMAANDAFKADHGYDIPLESAYRDAARNARVGGSPTSNHMRATAFDVNTKATELVKPYLEAQGFVSLGGTYKNPVTGKTQSEANHFDFRPGKTSKQSNGGGGGYAPPNTYQPTPPTSSELSRLDPYGIMGQGLNPYGLMGPNWQPPASIPLNYFTDRQAAAVKGLMPDTAYTPPKGIDTTRLSKNLFPMVTAPPPGASGWDMARNIAITAGPPVIAGLAGLGPLGIGLAAFGGGAANSVTNDVLANKPIDPLHAGVEGGVNTAASLVPILKGGLATRVLGNAALSGGVAAAASGVGQASQNKGIVNLNQVGRDALPAAVLGGSLGGIFGGKGAKTPEPVTKIPASLKKALQHDPEAARILQEAQTAEMPGLVNKAQFGPKPPGALEALEAKFNAQLGALDNTKAPGSVAPFEVNPSGSPAELMMKSQAQRQLANTMQRMDSGIMPTSRLAAMEAKVGLTPETPYTPQLGTSQITDPARLLSTAGQLETPRTTQSIPLGAGGTLEQSTQGIHYPGLGRTVEQASRPNPINVAPSASPTESFTVPTAKLSAAVKDLKMTRGLSDAEVKVTPEGPGQFKVEANPNPAFEEARAQYQKDIAVPGSAKRKLYNTLEKQKQEPTPTVAESLTNATQKAPEEVKLSPKVVEPTPTKSVALKGQETANQPLTVETPLDAPKGGTEQVKTQGSYDTPVGGKFGPGKVKPYTNLGNKTEAQGLRSGVFSGYHSPSIDALANAIDNNGVVVSRYRGSRTSSPQYSEFSPKGFSEGPQGLMVHGTNHEGNPRSYYVDAHRSNSSGFMGAIKVKEGAKGLDTYNVGSPGAIKGIHTDEVLKASQTAKRLKDVVPENRPDLQRTVNRLDKTLSSKKKLQMSDIKSAMDDLKRLQQKGGLEDFIKNLENEVGPCV